MRSINSEYEENNDIVLDMPPNRQSSSSFIPTNQIFKILTEETKIGTFRKNLIWGLPFLALGLLLLCVLYLKHAFRGLVKDMEDKPLDQVEIEERGYLFIFLFSYSLFIFSAISLRALYKPKPNYKKFLEIDEPLVAQQIENTDSCLFGTIANPQTEEDCAAWLVGRKEIIRHSLNECESLEPAVYSVLSGFGKHGVEAIDTEKQKEDLSQDLEDASTIYGAIPASTRLQIDAKKQEEDFIQNLEDTNTPYGKIPPQLQINSTAHYSTLPKREFFMEPTIAQLPSHVNQAIRSRNNMLLELIKELVWRRQVKFKATKNPAYSLNTMLKLIMELKHESLKIDSDNIQQQASFLVCLFAKIDKKQKTSPTASQFEIAWDSTKLCDEAHDAFAKLKKLYNPHEHQIQILAVMIRGTEVSKRLAEELLKEYTHSSGLLGAYIKAFHSDEFFSKDLAWFVDKINFDLSKLSEKDQIFLMKNLLKDKKKEKIAKEILQKNLDYFPKFFKIYINYYVDSQGIALEDLLQEIQWFFTKFGQRDLHELFNKESDIAAKVILLFLRHPNYKTAKRKQEPVYQIFWNLDAKAAKKVVAYVEKYAPELTGDLFLLESKDTFCNLPEHERLVDVQESHTFTERFVKNIEIFDGFELIKPLFKSKAQNKLTLAYKLLLLIFEHSDNELYKKQFRNYLKENFRHLTREELLAALQAAIPNKENNEESQHLRTLFAGIFCFTAEIVYKDKAKEIGRVIYRVLTHLFGYVGSEDSLLDALFRMLSERFSNPGRTSDRIARQAIIHDLFFYFLPACAYYAPQPENVYFLNNKAGKLEDFFTWLDVVNNNDLLYPLGLTIFGEIITGLVQNAGTGYKVLTCITRELKKGGWEDESRKYNFVVAAAYGLLLSDLPKDEQFTQINILINNCKTGNTDEYQLLMEKLYVASEQMNIRVDFYEFYFDMAEKYLQDIEKVEDTQRAHQRNLAVGLYLKVLINTKNLNELSIGLRNRMADTITTLFNKLAFKDYNYKGGLATLYGIDRNSSEAIRKLLIFFFTEISVAGRVPLYKWAKEFDGLCSTIHRCRIHKMTTDQESNSKSEPPFYPIEVIISDIKSDNLYTDSKTQPEVEKAIRNMVALYIYAQYKAMYPKSFEWQKIYHENNTSYRSKIKAALKVVGISEDNKNLSDIVQSAYSEHQHPPNDSSTIESALCVVSGDREFAEKIFLISKPQQPAVVNSNN